MIFFFTGGEILLESRQLHEATHQHNHTNHMKITLHIDDGHTPALIQLLAALVAKSQPVEASTDPAPGHPELPLVPQPTAGLRPEAAKAIQAATDAADPLKVAMDDPVEDITRREVPIPERMLPLPPVPEGYSRWVGRGEDFEKLIDADGRCVRWFMFAGKKWKPTSSFSTNGIFHIEAVKDEPAAEPTVTEAEPSVSLAQQAAADLRACLD